MKDGEDADEQFISFYTAWRGKLFKAVVAWTGDRHTAEDVVQDVMLLVRHYWGRYERPEILMYRQARQQLARRRSAVPVQVESLDQYRERSEEVPAWQALDVDGQLDLLAALRRLPARQREVIVLTELCDLEQATAAEILGISVSALKTHKARGLRALQSRLVTRLTSADSDPAGGDDT
ncbi:sigma-70 family RNA polymerase sigma factor [Plantactinospora sp. S1510]|uniref:Sigma-70 family RNA polymerase sigma factor n=1 Tax=Plantactinospora alkalitolerans TaxID=2789879 RepID=A0ABS0H8F6_9ACTN|nr:sigma-70 family RNA polymerase sigma factor [Plantactinospora alkalitolerans]MBF9134758.1 sigma-70 family RNA polymerase sigma factor [Plantactinospora alkalitolerans]